MKLVFIDLAHATKLGLLTKPKKKKKLGFILEKNQLFGEGKKIACKADSGNSIPREPRFTFVGRKGKPNDFSYNRWSSGNIIISRFYGFHVGIFPPRPVSVCRCICALVFSSQTSSTKASHPSGGSLQILLFYRKSLRNSHKRKTLTYLSSLASSNQEPLVSSTIN